MFTLIMLGTFLVAVEPGPHAIKCFNHLRMPPHGTIHKCTLYGFFDDDWLVKASKDLRALEFPNLDGIPLEKIAKLNWKKYDFHKGYGCYNFRLRVDHGSLWICDGPGWLRQIKLDELKRFERPVPPPKTRKDPIRPPMFFLKSLARQYTPFHQQENIPQAAWPVYGAGGPGAVPTTPSSCKSYLIFRNTKKFEAWDSLYRWDKEKKDWEVVVPQQNLETFDTLFLDDFYFFIRDADYYFVTESGKLYRAASPKPGEKSRTMKEVWADAKRPIAAIIEDADRDKVFLFAKHKTDARRGYYFEMKSATTFETFDPTKLKRVNIEGRAKTLLELWPLVAPQVTKSK